MLGWFRRKAVAWEVIVARLADAVIVEPGHEVHGSLDGIALRLRIDRAMQLVTIATTLAFERFSLRVTPRRGGTGQFAESFVVEAKPVELARFVLDDEVRSRLLAIEPRPTIQLLASTLTLEVEGFLDAPATIAALEAVARIARLLVDRDSMCRPAP
jgi:hypothetical protein